jgi:hypothetical protein
LPAAGGEAIFDAGWAGIEDAALEYPGAFELAEAARQRGGWHAPEHLEELVEPNGPFMGREEDRDRPAPLEQVRDIADLL